MTTFENIDEVIKLITANIISIYYENSKQSDNMN